MRPVCIRLGDIADRIGARVLGDPDVEVTGLGSLDSAGPGQLTHLSSRKYRRHLASTQATAVILADADAPRCPTNALVARNPYLAFARATQLFAMQSEPAAGVHPTAVVGRDVQLAAGVSVGANAVVGDGTQIGAGASIGAGANVGPGCVLGAGVRLHARVVVYEGVRIGARSMVHSGAVIGAPGFGFAPDERGALVAIEQLGSVVVGEDVRIGANTTIDRGALGDTVIGDGVKIDNQVQIGHNCIVGDHTIICGCTGLAGSTRIGRHCVLAGSVGVAGDGPIEIVDRVVVSGMTHVSSSITTPGVYSGGVLHSETRRWKRNALRFAELDGLARRLRALERALGRSDERD
jgi:UDP-3-O-[3-hydroxymyristoyl] glucosamine N-acyltransferase